MSIEGELMIYIKFNGMEKIWALGLKIYKITAKVDTFYFRKMFFLFVLATFCHYDKFTVLESAYNY